MSSNSIAAQIIVSDEQAKPEHVNVKLYEYPPSVKLVFKTLEGKATMTLRDIEKETYLPYRTVRYAVKRMKEANLVTRIFYVKDARRSLYRLAKWVYYCSFFESVCVFAVRPLRLALGMLRATARRRRLICVTLIENQFDFVAHG